MLWLGPASPCRPCWLLLIGCCPEDGPEAGMTPCIDCIPSRSALAACSVLALTLTPLPRCFLAAGDSLEVRPSYMSNLAWDVQKVRNTGLVGAQSWLELV